MAALTATSLMAARDAELMAMAGSNGKGSWWTRWLGDGEGDPLAA